MSYELNPTPNPGEDLEADAYYGEEDVNMDDLDLSFLDDEDAEPDAREDLHDKPKQ